MKEPASVGETHLEDGELVRYLDGEMTIAERAETAAHLLRCDGCHRALDGLRAERRELTEMLTDVPVPPLPSARREAARARVLAAAAARRPVSRPAAGSRPAYLKAAAVAGLLAGSSLTVPPVRAAVASFWNAVNDRVETVASRPDVLAQREVITLNNATIGFVPTADVFVIEIATQQAEGSLLLGVNPGSSVTARAVGGDEIVALVILPDGMRIENRADDEGDYAVNLPANLRELRVRIGGTHEIVYDIERLASSWISVVDLERSPGGPTVTVP